jgi:hypothetical protein
LITSKLSPGTSRREKGPAEGENGIGIQKDLVHAGEYYGRFRSSRSVVVPAWVRVLDNRTFSDGTSLESVTFEHGSGLERIDRRHRLFAAQVV